jgi:hypothetical protein
VSLRQSNLEAKMVDVVFLRSTYFEAAVDLDGKRPGVTVTVQPTALVRVVDQPLEPPTGRAGSGT